MGEEQAKKNAVAALRSLAREQDDAAADADLDNAEETRRRAASLATARETATHAVGVYLAASGDTPDAYNVGPALLALEAGSWSDEHRHTWVPVLIASDVLLAWAVAMETS